MEYTLGSGLLGAEASGCGAGAATTTRNPWFLFRLSAFLLFRYAERHLSAELFHEPPRTTR